MVGKWNNDNIEMIYLAYLRQKIAEGHTQQLTCLRLKSHFKSAFLIDFNVFELGVKNGDIKVYCQ